MTTEVYCVRNHGYTWTNKGNVFFKGYFIIDETLYRDTDAVEFLALISNYDDFNILVRKLYGCFAIIIRKDFELWGAVDRARSIPVYFSANGSIVSDCAETIRKKLGIDISDVKTTNLTSLLCAQFTFLNNTLYDSIKQLNLGQTLLIKDDTVEYVYYYRHKSNVREIGYEEAVLSLGNALRETFDRLITVVNNRPVLLSLSGGYDSRLVACMLKERGVTDVICYTYGGEHSYEVELSKKVADQLGYEWHFIAYTDQDIQSIFTNKNDEYFKMTNTHDYIVYLQNYLAIKKLKENNIIKKGSVVLTGLCGDMPSGAYVLPQEQLSSIDLSYDNLASEYISKLFDQFTVGKEVLLELINEVKEDIRNCNVQIDDIQNYVSLKDCMETAGVHSRCYLQANKVHEYFGFEWLIPLWDNEYLDFWYSLPMEYRVNQSFYEEYLINDLFSKFDIAFRKNKAVRAEDRNKERVGKKLIKKVKYLLGGILTRASFLLSIPIKRKFADPNNFGAATCLLYKRIHNKRVVNYRKANFQHLLSIYILEDRYGYSVFDRKAY